jgi:hypothetical protein
MILNGFEKRIVWEIFPEQEAPKPFLHCGGIGCFIISDYGLAADREIIKLALGGIKSCCSLSAALPGTGGNGSCL